jgi:ATP-dependent protease ClpP protease subunit
VAKTWYRMALAQNDATSAEISIYDPIGGWGISARDFRDDLARLGEVKQINLSINSPGGDVFDGVAIANMLARHPASVTATVDGLAASIASVIAMAADKVRMPENAMMMVHNPASLLLGVFNSAEMRQEADLLDKIQQSIATSYVAKTGLSAEEVTQLLDATTWLSAQEAKDKGFADEVLPARKMQAKFDPAQLAKFGAVPPAVLALIEGKTAETEAEAAAAAAAEAEADAKAAEEAAAVEAAAAEAQARTTATAKATDDERARCAEIHELCKLAGKPGQAGQFIGQGKSVAETRTALLAMPRGTAKTEDEVSARHNAAATDAAKSWDEIIKRKNERVGA